MTKKLAAPRDAAELRHQAEARLRERGKKTGAPLPTETDSQRLVHELQVHQLELEMQNEELANSRAEMEALLHRYADLYDFAPVAYLTLERNGEIVQANLAGARLLGVERDELIKRRLAVFVAPQSRAALSAFLHNVFTRRSRSICEIPLLKDGSDARWVRIEASLSPALRGQPVLCHAVVSDITESKQAEEDLRHESTHDALTGLYSRSFFVQEMARLERGRAFPVSIVMADVDRLKETNDRDGHALGDACLKRVAQALTAAFRAEDVVARIGGDEFAVLLPSTDAAAARVSLQRVRQALQDNNAAHAGAPICLSLGVGTAVKPGPLAEVLKEADASMYREKRERDTL